MPCSSHHGDTLLGLHYAVWGKNVSVFPGLGGCAMRDFLDSTPFFWLRLVTFFWGTCCRVLEVGCH